MRTPDDFLTGFSIRTTDEIQLCDIHDETLKQTIESANEEGLRDECDVCGLVVVCLIPRASHHSGQGN